MPVSILDYNFYIEDACLLIGLSVSKTVSDKRVLV